jgi:hypothetical protein
MRQEDKEGKRERRRRQRGKERRKDKKTKKKIKTQVYRERKTQRTYRDKIAEIRREGDKETKRN